MMSIGEMSITVLRTIMPHASHRHLRKGSRSTNQLAIADRKGNFLYYH